MVTLFLKPGITYSSMESPILKIQLKNAFYTRIRKKQSPLRVNIRTNFPVIITQVFQ